MNKSHQVISDFNCIDLSMPLKEDYFHSIDTLFTGQNSINPVAKTICIFFRKLCNKNIDSRTSLMWTRVSVLRFGMQ